MISSSSFASSGPLSCNQDPALRRDIASEAFQDVVQYLELEFVRDAKALAWLKSVKSTSINDLLDTTRDVENKYTESSRSKQGVRKWLTGLSSRIMHYGKVMDTLAQHNPEYVSLVWGVVKFILMGIINHGNLVAQFSQAISMIAEVLPITQLSAELYQSDHMKNAVANLYRHILLFLKQAVKWYTVGPAGRALTALFKPFELSYKDTVEQIRLCAGTIDSIASISVKAEVRDINMFLQEVSQRLVKRDEKLHEMQRRFEEGHADLTVMLKTILGKLNSNTPKIDSIHISMQDIHPRIIDMHLHDILSTLQPQHCPEQALARHKSIIRRTSNPRRIRARQTNPQAARIFTVIGNWITSPKSSLLVLNTQPRAQARVKEIATEVIGRVRAPGQVQGQTGTTSSNVIWYLSRSGNETTRTEILKSLVFQAIKLAPKLVVGVKFDSNSLTVAKLGGHHEEHEWLELLYWTLQRLPAGCFVVVEAEDLLFGDAESEQASNLIEMFQGLAGRLGENGINGVKFLVVGYGKNSASEKPGGVEQIVVTVDVYREAPVLPRARLTGQPARSIGFGLRGRRMGARGLGKEGRW
ncbi:hypothetical protein QBC37DRAFT_433328 [Rhypophila decipiens]|uniref:DUF7708 domain-containing protein n=1 Tax=Rhypophila decipiens TaxID=261697 RepID=A0AAN7B260_9PEZI|nr:hypothetical protein QBC37DRAFT_433328 [Rhypophila decipiens]